MLDIFKEVFSEKFEICALTDIKNYKEDVFINHQHRFRKAISKRLYQMLQNKMITSKKFKNVTLKVLYDPKKIISLIDFILRTFGYQLRKIKKGEDLLLSIYKDDMYTKMS